MPMWIALTGLQRACTCCLCLLPCSAMLEGCCSGAVGMLPMPSRCCSGGVCVLPMRSPNTRISAMWGLLQRCCGCCQCPLSIPALAPCEGCSSGAMGAANALSQCPYSRHVRAAAAVLPIPVLAPREGCCSVAADARISATWGLVRNHAITMVVRNYAIHTACQVIVMSSEYMKGCSKFFNQKMCELIFIVYSYFIFVGKFLTVNVQDISCDFSVPRE